MAQLCILHAEEQIQFAKDVHDIDLNPEFWRADIQGKTQSETFESNFKDLISQLMTHNTQEYTEEYKRYIILDDLCF